MEGWREISFGQLLSQPVRNGIYKQKQFHGRGVKIVNMGELFSYPRLTDVPMKRLELSESEKERFLLRTGDLIFARRSLTAEGAGKCSIIHAITEDTTFESSIICARPNFKKCCSLFLYYYFNSPYGKYLLGTILRQVAVAGITGKDLVELEIKVPLLEEQQAIAAVLSSLDDKIDLLHRQNKTLEALAQTLFRQWFVEEADASWTEGTFFDEFDILMGQSPQGTTFNEIADGLPMFQGSADFGFRFPTNRIYTNSPIRIANVFDTLISVRAPVGDQNMARSRCCIGRGLSAIRYKKNPSYYNYTYYKVMSLLDKIKLYNDEGTVFGSISKSDFEKIPTIMPPESDIASCELRLKNIDGKIVNNIDQINTLTKIRDTLLPKLMSGEVCVL